MFWRKKNKKSACKHFWQHVSDDHISINQGNSVGLEDACWIVCIHCEKEDLVYTESWNRIKRRQDILVNSKDITLNSDVMNLLTQLSNDVFIYNSAMTDNWSGYATVIDERRESINQAVHKLRHILNTKEQ